MDAILLTPIVCTSATVGKQELAFGAVGQNRVKEISWYQHLTLDYAMVWLPVHWLKVLSDDLRVSSGECAILADVRVQTENKID
jgi:hypothetical protein